MKSNENRYGKSGSVTGRDGKSPEKKDVKSILKNSGRANRFNSDNQADQNNIMDQKPSFRKRNDASQSHSEQNFNSDRFNRKPGYGNSQSGSRPEQNFNRPDRYNRNENFNRDQDRPSSKRPRFKTTQDGVKKYQPLDERSGRLHFRKPGEDGQFIETRFDNKKDGVTYRKPFKKRDGQYNPNAKYSNKKQIEYKKSYVDLTKPVRLNKFLANAGICSRREADEFIQAGVISVNGEVVTQLGTKVMHTDRIMFHNQLVRSERKVYLLLNKPKDCVTTVEDTHSRKTVLDIVKNACSERIYPVGRLDRNTTGVLLLTNDGDLASQLTHPKYDKKKIYHVSLDKPLEVADFETIMSGVMLDDEKVAADELSFVKDDDLKQVGIEIHSGQNRVVRRIFEKLGYKVVRLDRVFFAGLTKKNIPRGKYRFLSEREVNMLKMGAYE